MANETTTEFWSVDGVPLQTYAYNITTIGGDLLAARPLRGDNLTIPHAFGERYMPKTPDSITLTFGMWVIGANPDGTIPTKPSQKFKDNWRMLRKLLWTPYREVTLTKRWRDETGTMRTASAKAQFVSGLTPSMTGTSRASFTVDMRLSDPFFYEDPTTVTLVNGTQTVTNLGDAPTRNIILTIAGARGANLTIWNRTLGHYVAVRDAIASGSLLTLDVKQFKATMSGGSSYNAISSITHAGSASWFELAPGANTIEVVSTSGTGSINLQYQRGWL